MAKTDFTTNTSKFIKTRTNSSSGITLTIKISKTSKLLIKAINAHISFALISDLSLLQSKLFKFQASKNLISSKRVKEIWFSQNKDKSKLGNSEISIYWF